MTGRYNYSNTNSKGIEKNKSRCRHQSYKVVSNSEPKTPPLPHWLSSNINELMKQKKCLQNELRHLQKRSGQELCQLSTTYSEISQSKKRRNIEKGDTNRKKKLILKSELSPIYDMNNADIESEDEESIIEKRRQNRKKLLAKLNNAGYDNNRTLDNTDIKNKLNKHCDNNSNQIKVTTKETTDMFSENYVRVDDEQLDNYFRSLDDSVQTDGYYNIRPGDKIENMRYLVKSILGQGVFATVVKAQDYSNSGKEVAIKIIRNNAVMYKSGLKEIDLLKKISDIDCNSKYNCVKYLRHFMHNGHLCLVFETLCMNLKTLLKQNGKRQGICMNPLVSYTKQMFNALKFLRKIGIVHADLKPDNILINKQKTLLKLCDFGSAYLVDNYEATPYVVSRFYRAPEIILGIPYRFSVDIWSAACTIYEMATGKIMFTGNSNNKMLKCFMDLKGKFSSKVLRKGKYKDQHFNYNNNFLLHKKDELTKREKVFEITNITVTRNIYKELMFNPNLGDNYKKLSQLKNLLDKMLVTDIQHRISIFDCIRHPFITED